MPSIRVSESIAANDTNPNIIAGSQFEFAPMVEEVDIALTADAAGLVCDISFGPDIQVSGAPIPVEQGTGFGPKIPDNVLVSGAADGGDRITIQVRNTTAGALVATAQIFTKPV